MSWPFVLGQVLLAQAAADAPKADPSAEMIRFIVPMLPILFLFYILLWRPQAQEQKKRDQLLNTLKKNDRVVTIGGVLGTVANISADGKEVTLKLDEGRMRVLRTGIQAKLSSDESSDTSSST